MTWLTYASLSIFFSIATNLLTRVLAVKSDNTRAFAFVYGVFTTTIAAFLFIPHVDFGNISASTKIVLLIILASALYGIFDRTQFSARKHIDASTLSILFRGSALITFFASILILGESITLNKMLGATLIVLANIILSYKDRTLKIKKEWLYAIPPVVTLGLVYVIDKVVVQSFPSELYNVIVWITPLLFVYFPYIPKKQLKREFKVGPLWIALAATANVLTYYFILKAFELYEASRIVMVTSTSTIFVVLAGVLLLKERDHIPQKLMASIVAVGGILLII